MTGIRRVVQAGTPRYGATSYSLTTNTDYGWIAESAKTAVISC